MELAKGMGKPAIEIDALSSEERLDLLERVWESLSQIPAAVPVTEEQLAELDRRSSELDRDKDDGRPMGVPWEEVLRQLRARR